MQLDSSMRLGNSVLKAVCFKRYIVGRHFEASIAELSRFRIPVLVVSNRCFSDNQVFSLYGEDRLDISFKNQVITIKGLTVPLVFYLAKSSGLNRPEPRWVK